MLPEPLSTDTTPVSSPPALTVSQLTAQIKGQLEAGFPNMWVTGEVSNFSRPSSGHCYFTLKDDAAQIRAVIWRGSAAKMRFDFTDGLELLCHGRIDVYAPRGSYQLVIDQAQPKGLGALELALRQLRERLGAEGLFDADRKQPLPTMPRRVGFVTSPTGAAVRDFLEVARRRWAGIDVLVIPTRVQGDGAADEIAHAIRQAQQVTPRLDALVVGRGGGSMEDLWSFNEEAVVRALANCPLPTVSAVGHEIDTTLADLAADVRALTPSEAAERVIPAGEEMTRRVRTLGERLHNAARRTVTTRSDRLGRLRERPPLARPFALIENASRRVDELELAARSAMRRRLSDQQARVGQLAGKLESLSPLAVLGRGYSLTLDADGAVVRSTSQVVAGDALSIRLSEGRIEAIVDATRDKS
ncbi:MAG: exodeoxyribonuclease VII large subunit [Planctomycetota bacterium]